jgi:hypothetical protein
VTPASYQIFPAAYEKEMTEKRLHAIKFDDKFTAARTQQQVQHL